MNIPIQESIYIVFVLSANCLGEGRGVYYAHKRVIPAHEKHYCATADVDSNTTVIGAWVVGWWLLAI